MTLLFDGDNSYLLAVKKLAKVLKFDLKTCLVKITKLHSLGSRKKNGKLLLITSLNIVEGNNFVVYYFSENN